MFRRWMVVGHLVALGLVVWQACALASHCNATTGLCAGPYTYTCPPPPCNYKKIQNPSFYCCCSMYYSGNNTYRCCEYQCVYTRCETLSGTACTSWQREQTTSQPSPQIQKQCYNFGTGRDCTCQKQPAGCTNDGGEI